MQQPAGDAGPLDSAFGGAGGAGMAVDALRKVGDYSWTGAVVTFVLLVAVLFLRRLLPPDRQKRGRVALVLLALSLLLRLAAVGLALLDKETAASVLGFVSTLFFAFGVTGVIALLVLDIGLARVGVSVPELVRDILQALAFAVITIAVLQGAGVNLIGLITTSAVLTAIIGLALQSTIANLFAGLTLQLDRTINVGDWVRTGDYVGRIHEIRWRSTLMVTKDGDLLIIPNGQILGNAVRNYSRPTLAHRMWIKVGFAYRHPPSEVRRVLLEAARGAPGVLAEPAPDVLLQDFGDSAILYALRYWIDEFRRDDPIDTEVRTRIWYGAQRAGIEIPFPIRTVFMNTVSDEQTARLRAREVEARGKMLADNELFSALSDEDRQVLAGLLRTVRFTGGEIILRQGASGDSLYLIEEGEVAVRLSVDGAEREVATLRDGQFFGEMSLMTGEPRRATVVARGDTTCFVVDKHAFQQVLVRRPQVAEEISAVLGKRQGELEGERENLSAEARARRAAENSSRLLRRIRDFFNLG
jgi:small-conductance mechanosensitive channel/CRP-like cAMP-binding protein